LGLEICDLPDLAISTFNCIVRSGGNRVVYALNAILKSVFLSLSLWIQLLRKQAEKDHEQKSMFGHTQIAVVNFIVR